MDIGALSIGMNQAGLGQAVGIRVLSMVKDQAESNGAQLIQMMQQAAQPHLGSKLDVRV
ncbi:YjfB family protein [Paenibacillus kobensis]|uniref:YjfB family protein n=1 Tax=Paenibacillus kobensis TaxID=59841 RepID=UPI000FD8DCA4|nr:YjfB family protein [Paenibacillus kobensis]